MKDILDEILYLTGNNRIWVAFSGGVDSHVLLHLLAEARQNTQLQAIHIDHGLHADSAAWAVHCATVAADLDVPFTVIKVTVVDADNEGVESAARTARYEAICNVIQAGDVVLTAQHQQDQAETLLLQLLRGAGPKGLAAMPTASVLGTGRLIRPLLYTSKADIVTYAKQHKLKWIDDPSNEDSRWDRNYLRHTLWPKLTERWPSTAKTLSRSATHCADASELLEILAEQDLARLERDKQSTSLPISALLSLPTKQCRNLLRHWCQWQGLPLPSTAQLQKIIEEVCLAAKDAAPLVEWQGVDVRRYQDTLYIAQPLPAHDNQQQYVLTDRTPIELNQQQQFCWQEQSDQGLKMAKFEGGWLLRFRQGGEKIQLAGRTHHSQLKHLMQEWKIPPWLRDRVPLIFDGDKLIAVVGYAVAEGYAASADELGINPCVETEIIEHDFD